MPVRRTGAYRHKKALLTTVVWLVMHMATVFGNISQLWNKDENGPLQCCLATAGHSRDVLGQLYKRQVKKSKK